MNRGYDVSLFLILSIMKNLIVHPDSASVELTEFKTIFAFRVTFTGKIHVGGVPEGKIRRWNYRRKCENFLGLIIQSFDSGVLYYLQHQTSMD